LQTTISLNVLHSPQQNIIDSTFNEWRKRLMVSVRADGQHFVLNIYCKLVYS